MSIYKDKNFEESKMSEKTLEHLWKEHIKASSKEKWRIHNFIRSLSHKLSIPEKLFNFFEKYLKEIDSDNSMVLVTDKISTGSLKALIAENRICAIHVPNFCSPEVAESLSKSALEEFTHWKLGGVLSTDMFYAGGSIPKEVADHSWPDFCRYFSERDDFVSRQRTLSHGKWPVDRLRLELDQAWPFGACLGQYLGQKLRPAIMRVMQEKNGFDFSSPKHGFIHTDDSLKLDYSRATFTANIYLKIPEEGGNLYVWNINLKRIKGFYNYLTAHVFAMIMAQGYIFNIGWQEKILKLLPKPHIIQPKRGDLVIFHSGRPHAVAPVAKGCRVTNQLFIFSKGDSPLTIGS